MIQYYVSIPCNGFEACCGHSTKVVVQRHTVLNSSKSVSSFVRKILLHLKDISTKKSGEGGSRSTSDLIGVQRCSSPKSRSSLNMEKSGNNAASAGNLTENTKEKIRCRFGSYEKSNAPAIASCPSKETLASNAKTQTSRELAIHEKGSQNQHCIYSSSTSSLKRYTISAQALPLMATDAKIPDGRAIVQTVPENTSSELLINSTKQNRLDLNRDGFSQRTSTFQPEGKAVISKFGGLTITRSSSLSSATKSAHSQAITLDSSSLPGSKTQRKKRYAPSSFPEDFYERFPNPDPMFPYGVIDMANVTSPSLIDCVSAYSADSNSSSHVSETRSFQHMKENSSNTASETVLENSTFYSTVHYFTDCPHSSPPATRPLDAQPFLRQGGLCEETGSPRSMIEGACFQCDSEQRRRQEHCIVMDFTLRLQRLSSRLSALIEDIENADLDMKDDTLHNDMAKAWDEVFNAGVANAVRLIEEEIDELRDMEEQEVNKIWAGYPRRWGPGTLGVQRMYACNNKDHDITAKKATQEGSNSRIEKGETREGSTKMTQPGSLASRRRNISQTSLQTTMTASSSSKDTLVSTDMDGRMKIDWIRQELD